MTASITYLNHIFTAGGAMVIKAGMNRVAHDSGRYHAEDDFKRQRNSNPDFWNCYAGMEAHVFEMGYTYRYAELAQGGGYGGSAA